MKKNEKLQTKEKQCYIPMEVTPETIEDFNIDPSEVEGAKIGSRSVRVIKVPVTEEVYKGHMRSLWREDKRRQRHIDDASLEQRSEELNFEDIDLNTDVEDVCMKKLFLEELRKALDELEEIDRKIFTMLSGGASQAEIGRSVGMSQRGAGKRIEKIQNKLSKHLKDYRDIFHQDVIQKYFLNRKKF